MDKEQGKGEQIGYIRVSTVEQNTERQLDGLELDRIYTDKCSGSNTNRPQLLAMIDYAREGDTIHVHSIDRLARSTKDLEQLVHDLQEKGVSLKFHNPTLTFSGKPDPAEQLLFTMLGAVAQFERAIIKERQAEGIAKAKAKGKYQGRRADKDKHERLRQLRAEGKSLNEIATMTECSLSTVKRAVKGITKGSVTS